MKKIGVRVSRFLSNFLLAQLAVTLVSLPILVHWGLSFSMLSFLGNLIFSPVLTTFLVLASCVFFTQLMHIPNDMLLYLLNYLVNFWESLLAWASPSCLFSCAQPTDFLLYVLYCVPIAAFLCIRYGGIISTLGKVVILSFFLVVSWLLLGTYARYRVLTCSLDSSLINFDAALDIKINDDGLLLITDSGYFAKKVSPEKVVEFEIRPFLTKRLGSVHVKSILLKKVGQRAFVAAKALCDAFCVDEVKIPFFKQTLSKSAWRAFFELKHCATKRGILFTRCKKDSAGLRDKSFHGVHHEIQH